MPTEVKLWELVDGRLKDVGDASLADARLEKDLEDWIVTNPALLGEDFLIIGRQCQTVAGPLDLLLINRDGQLAVAELKRDLSAREAVAQALDYASWLDDLEPEQILEIASNFLRRPLEEAFEDHYGKELPDISPQNQRILIVASRLDAAAERIVNYLSERHHVNLNAVLFKYTRLSDGREMLARTVLVPEEVARERSTRGPRVRPTAEELRLMGEERHVNNLVRLFEDPMEKYWGALESRTFGGSIRYRRQGKIIFGLNVSGKGWAAPEGAVDVWIRPSTISELTGVSLADIESRLAEYKPIAHIEAGGTGVVLRIADPKTANKLISDLKSWFDSERGLAAAS